MSDLYHEIILEELKNPQNKGELVDADVKHFATNASCGDDMTVFLKVSNGQVKDISWQGQGCAISQATMSLLSEELKGQPVQKVFELQQSYLEELIGIEKISPGRVKCLMLGLNAVQHALQQL